MERKRNPNLSIPKHRSQPSDQLILHRCLSYQQHYRSTSPNDTDTEPESAHVRFLADNKSKWGNHNLLRNSSHHLAPGTTSRLYPSYSPLFQDSPTNSISPQRIQANPTEATTTLQHYKHYNELRCNRGERKSNEPGILTPAIKPKSSIHTDIS